MQQAHFLWLRDEPLGVSVAFLADEEAAAVVVRWCFLEAIVDVERDREEEVCERCAVLDEEAVDEADEAILDLRADFLLRLLSLLSWLSSLTLSSRGAFFCLAGLEQALFFNSTWLETLI